MGKKTKDFPRSRGIFLEYDLINSLSWGELTRSEIDVFMVFYLKRKFLSQKNAKKAHVDWHTITNNGQIVFPYAEAEKYGINKTTFTRALDKLIRVGFIDIAKQSQDRIPTLYSISERWRKFGTAVYKNVERLKYNNGVGARSRFKPNERQQISPSKMKVDKSIITLKNAGEKLRNF